MKNSKNSSLHYLMLAGIIALGAILRFWNLDLKPLWLDEVITALLSLGRPYKDVPLEVVLPLSTLQQLFTLQPNVSCPEIAQAVASQSTHPPLFFCLMHQWLSWVEPLTQPLSWKLRALPALFGVSAIAAVYCLNRIAFSPTAGLMGAALMAVLSLWGLPLPGSASLHAADTFNYPGTVGINSNSARSLLPAAAATTNSLVVLGDRQQHRLLRPLLFHSRFHCPASDANWADVLASLDAAKGQLASRHSCGQWCSGELSALAASVVRGYWTPRNRVALEA
jgi:hypothetical protein